MLPRTQKRYPGVAKRFASNQACEVEMLQNVRLETSQPDATIVSREKLSRRFKFNRLSLTVSFHVTGYRPWHVNLIKLSGSPPGTCDRIQHGCPWRQNTLYTHVRALLVALITAMMHCLCRRREWVRNLQDGSLTVPPDTLRFQGIRQSSFRWFCLTRECLKSL